MAVGEGDGWEEDGVEVGEGDRGHGGGVSG